MNFPLTVKIKYQSTNCVTIATVFHIASIINMHIQVYVSMYYLFEEKSTTLGE